MPKKKDRLGYLGEPEATRMVKAFYEDSRMRRRAAVLCGAGLGLLMVWSELVLFYSMSH
jgi:hypothetical protein